MTDKIFSSPIGGVDESSISSGLSAARTIGTTTRAHKGADYKVPVGTPILGIADNGEVIYAKLHTGSTPASSYGNLVIVKYLIDGVIYYARYAHLSSIEVQVGDTVNRGDMLGESGGQKGLPESGHSTGPHLHFEIRVVDPGIIIENPEKRAFAGEYKNPNDYIDYSLNTTFDKVKFALFGPDEDPEEFIELARENPDFIDNLRNSVVKGDNVAAIDQEINAFLDAMRNAIQDQLQQTLLDAHTIGSYLVDFLKGLSRAEATAPNVIRRDPLTLDLDGDGVELVSLTKSNTFFDLDEDGLRERVGWVKADDGILVFDENANNSVDNINELFGYVDENGNEVTGTAELKTYDTGSVILVNQTDAFGTVLVDDNGNPLTQEVVIGANDGVIDSKDAIFSQLKLWQDLNQDGISQDGELRFLGDYNISSIDVTTTTTTNKNVEGNVIISTGTYQTSVTNEDGSITNSTKQYANLDLAIDQTNSSAYSYQDAEGNVISYNLNLEVLALPLSRGYGNVAAWHVAMSEDSALLTMMKDMVNLTNGVTYDNLTTKVENFIYEWTGTQNITGNRGWFSGQKLGAMEEIRGIDFC